MTNRTRGCEDTVTYYGGIPSKRTDVSTVIIKPSVKRIDGWAFRDWNSLRNIAIPPSVTAIGHRSFWNCKSIVTMQLPPSITSIGNNAFNECISLRTLTIPPSVTSIGTGTFYHCMSLTEVTIPPSVTTIGCSAFSYCTSLIEITLPPLLTFLWENTFQLCTSLVSVTFSTDPTGLAISAFDLCDSLTTVRAPSFSTNTFDTQPATLTDALSEAGYSALNLRAAHEGQSIHPPRWQTRYDWVSWYYMAEVEAETRSDAGRLPLCSAAAWSFRWIDVGTIFKLNMGALHEVDKVTGLPLFVLAAMGEESDLESTYNLLRLYPPAMAMCMGVV